jgi:hypothetical protein
MKQTWGVYSAKHYAANETERGSPEGTVILWWDEEAKTWVCPSGPRKEYRFTDRNRALSRLYDLRACQKDKTSEYYPKLRIFTVISNAVAAARAVSKERRQIQSYINLRINASPQAERDALIKLQDWMDERQKKEELDA